MPAKSHPTRVNLGFEASTIEYEDGQFVVEIVLGSTVVWTERFREIDISTFAREAQPASVEAAVDRAVARFASRLATSLTD